MQNYAGSVLCLAKTAEPDTAAFNAPGDRLPHEEAPPRRPDRQLRRPRAGEGTARRVRQRIRPPLPRLHAATRQTHCLTGGYLYVCVIPKSRYPARIAVNRYKFPRQLLSSVFGLTRSVPLKEGDLSCRRYDTRVKVIDEVLNMKSARANSRQLICVGGWPRSQCSLSTTLRVAGDPGPSHLGTGEDAFSPTSRCRIGVAFCP